MAAEDVMASRLAAFYSAYEIVEYLRFLFSVEEIPPVFPVSVDNLATILLRHISCVPFNNIEMHYSVHRMDPLCPRSVFDKVIRRERGGIHLELNSLFTTLLCSIGYNAWLVPARVAVEQTKPSNGSRAFRGITHCVPLVEIADVLTGEKQVYLADVASGGANILTPIPLEAATPEDDPYPGVLEESHRLVRVFLPGVLRPELHWLLQHRTGDDAPWVDLYAFQEHEMTRNDFRALSRSSVERLSVLAENVIAARIIRDGDEAVGKYVLLNNQLKTVKQADGVSADSTDPLTAETVTLLVNETARAEALREFFWIDLDAAERDAILQRKTALPSF
ncbi:hypothetical protein Dda_1740 [Drechslerella dactyloides]|uniref:Arylamine N-acetyltransferase n=1 Tax=Drechslerella dactyloides TaxID=74499 RepID=A0AAD6J414_DREDA|nr:hypothetical protein Dda_1740 [Drechslerella dactyloides]